MGRLLVASRWAILLAVIPSLAAFFALLMTAVLKAGKSLYVFTAGADVSAAPVKALALSLIEVADLFLLATVFYLMAIGLYELFLGVELPLPGWMAIHDLDDLKAKLCKVIIVLLGVLFLGQAVHWDGEANLLPYGAGIALVIAALTYFLSTKAKGHGEAGSDTSAKL